MERVLAVLVCYAILEGIPLIFCKIQITEPITSRIGTDVILQCVYSGDDQWLLLQWKKESGENNYVTISSASSTTSEVRIHSNERLSINASIVQEQKTVTFNLFIYDLWCTDGTKYKCDITTIRNFVSMETRLTVEYPPERPQINYDTLVIQLNETFRVSCQGQVGFPPGKLQWYSRGKHQNGYTLITEQDSVTLPTENPCSPMVVTYINITMTTDIDGNIYRCALKSRYLEHMKWFYFDDVLLKSPAGSYPADCGFEGGGGWSTRRVPPNSDEHLPAPLQYYPHNAQLSHVLPPFVQVKEVIQYREREEVRATTSERNGAQTNAFSDFTIIFILTSLVLFVNKL